MHCCGASGEPFDPLKLTGTSLGTFEPKIAHLMADL